MRIFATAASIMLAQRVASLLDAEATVVETHMFSNGQIEVGLPSAAVSGVDAVLFQIFPDRVHDRIVEMLLILDLLRSLSSRRITAVLPYLPYSRSDAPVMAGGPVPARLFATLLEQAGLERLVTAALHTPQLRGLFTGPVIEIDCTRVLADGLRTLVRGDAIVVSPDLGGGKRAERLAVALGVPMAVMRKRRRDGVKESFEVLGDVAGRHAIILDDEVNSGETLLSAAAALRTQGVVDVSAAAAHALFTPEALERLSHGDIGRLLVTDSTGFAGSVVPPVEVLTLAPDLAAALCTPAAPKPDPVAATNESRAGRG